MKVVSTPRVHVFQQNASWFGAIVKGLELKGPE